MSKLKEEFQSVEIYNAVEKSVKTAKGVVKPEQLLTSTGYSRDEVSEALDRMLELFEAKVTLSNEGKLQYLFRYPLYKRGKKTVGEVLINGVKLIGKVLKQVYKVSFGIILVAYAIFFTLILIALMFGGRSDNNNNNSSGGAIHLLGAIWRVLFEMMYWKTIFGPTTWQTDRYGNHYQVTKKDKDKGAGFIKGVYSFVFGPDLPKLDPLANAREVAAWIRLHSKGKLTSATIIELSGVSYEKADSLLAEYSAKFKGDLEVSNEGVLYADFNALLTKIDIVDRPKESQHIEYYKDEVEAPVEFTGNSSGRNFAVAALNSFNIIMSAIMLNVTASPIYYTNNSGEMAYYDFTSYSLVFLFPLVVSILYFIIPIIRIPSFISRKKRRKQRVLHKMLVGYICESRKKNFTIDELCSHFNVGLKGDNSYTRTDIENCMKKIVVELQGTTAINEDGEVLYVFERLYNELTMNERNTQ